MFGNGAGKSVRRSVVVNHKRVSAGSGPDRDEQFQHIAAQRLRFAERGLPIISIDTKKRELVGNFKNHGTTWERSPHTWQSAECITKPAEAC